MNLNQGPTPVRLLRPIMAMAVLIFCCEGASAAASPLSVQLTLVPVDTAAGDVARTAKLVGPTTSGKAWIGDASLEPSRWRPDDILSANSATPDFSDLVQKIHQEVNAFRESQGLSPLSLDPAISAQARQHSESMVQSGALSHDGFEQRITELRQTLSFSSAAENVASNFGYADPAQQAVEGWKESPDHRQNMLSNSSRTGIGIAQDDQGTYYFTQIFWRP